MSVMARNAVFYCSFSSLPRYWFRSLDFLRLILVLRFGLSETLGIRSTLGIFVLVVPALWFGYLFSTLITQ